MSASSAGKTSNAPLSPPLSTPDHNQEHHPKTISCARCQQRKVKCDKQQPACSSCVRHRADCHYLLPAPARRKKKRPAEDDASSRLKRYEQLLQRHGIVFDHDDPEDGGISANVVWGEAKTGLISALKDELARQYLDDTPREDKVTGKFVQDGGKSNFVEDGFWNKLVYEELQGPRDMLRLTQVKSANPGMELTLRDELFSAGDLLLRGGPSNQSLDLKAAHPSPVNIFRLWQIYLDNVNPLTKILHAPTMQQRIVESSGNLENISKEWEAMLFAIYFAALNSMPYDECQDAFGQNKGVLLKQFHAALRTALIRSEFTNCTDILAVQAFLLYVYYEPNSMWILTGTLVRIAQRLGLHRDGTRIGLKPFETEIRRRIWWQVLSYDGQQSELCGAGLSVSAPLTDVERPTNINDSELSPDMSSLPSERNGPTEMMFCSFRCEIGLYLRDVKRVRKFRDLVQKDDWPDMDDQKSLDELWETCERKYFQYCDPNIPYHLFVAVSGRALITVLRLISRHPRAYPTGSGPMSVEERKKTFAIALEIIEIYNHSLRDPSLRRFLWHVNVQFQWHAFVILAHELRNCPDDEQADRAWSEIGTLFSSIPDVITHEGTALHNAIGKLMLQAWTVRERQLKERTPKEEWSVPPFIVILQAQQDARKRDPQNSATSSSAAPKDVPVQATSSTTAFSAPPVDVFNSQTQHLKYPLGANAMTTSMQMAGIGGAAGPGPGPGPGPTVGMGNGANGNGFNDSMFFMTQDPMNWNEWADMLQGYELQNMPSFSD